MELWLRDYTANHSTEARQAADSVLHKLRAATASLHDRLETQLNLLRPSLAIEDYLALLADLYGYYRPWEQASWPVLTERTPALLAGRRKAELLADDLRHFQVCPDHLPLCDRLPRIDTASQALGSLYVLEGSTLGGQILSRHFGKTLGLESAGMSFFRGYGDKTGLMWKRFCDVLNDGSKPSDEPEMIASAQATFETLTAWVAGGKSA